MPLRSSISRWSWAVTITAGVAAALAFAPVDQKPEPGKKPSISVRANPPVGFSPLRVVVTAELKGGSDDYADFYCASVEWEWGDDTRSETKADCDPYEAGKSEIKRRFVQEHVFRSMSNDMPGSPTGPLQYRVKFILKQKNKVVGSGQATVELRGIGH